MAGLLLLWDDLGDGDENLNSQQTYTILVVLGKMLEHGYHFFNNNRGGHLLHKLRKVDCRLSAHHGGLIVDELSELLP